MSNIFRKLTGWVGALACATLLAACGGGGGNPGSSGNNSGNGNGNGTGTTPTPTITVTFVDAAGNASNTATSVAPLTAQAKLVDAAGKAVANAVISFTTDPTVATITPATGTALTDANGVAKVQVTPATAATAGAARLTATSVVGSTTVTGTGNFQTLATATTSGAAVSVALVDANGAPAVSLSNSSSLTGRATVVDKNGKPIAGALVTFTADANLVALSPSSGTTLSDANGVASVGLRPASLASSGAGTLTASTTVDGNAIFGSRNYQTMATSLSLSPITLSSTSIPAYGSTTISVNVMAGNAKYTERQLDVLLNSPCVAAGKATVATTVPTVSGTAQAVYRDQGCGTTDVISATASGIVSSSSATLSIAAPTAASVQFVSATPSDRSIVIRGQGGLGRVETASLTFRVFDTFGNPLSNQRVTFSTVTTTITLNKLTDTTDANGQVVTTVNSGSVPTSFRIRATLDSGASTLSDSLVVTTGLPVQRAMSLSLTSPNVEGWGHDSGTSTPASMVNVLLADQNGNPVPDGTPIVFQTNMGAVGTSSKGACNTNNGGCSVDFRTQNPRFPTPGSPATPCNTTASGWTDSTRTGLATICASTTDGVNTLYQKISLFFSGFFATKVYMDGGITPISRTSATDLGSASSSASKTFLLQLNDLNDNPMPARSTVAITDIVNGNAVGVSPSTVPNVFAHSAVSDVASGELITNASPPQGSSHTVSVGVSINPDTGCSPKTVTFNVTVTTPLNNVTSYPFKVNFTCP